MKWLNKKSLLDPYLYLMPAILFILVFSGGGLLMAGIESLSNSGYLFSNYVSLLKDQTFWQSFLLSVYIAFVSTIFSLILGLIITRVLFKMFIKDYWKYLIWVPMLIPHFIGAYIIYIFFSQGGFISSASFHAGMIQDLKQFPVVVNDPYYVGVILSYIWKEIPFVVLMLLPVYQEIDSRYEKVVYTLGGSSWTVFRTVEWPWLVPVLIETSFILFSFIIAAYEIPALLGVTYPKMLSVLAYEWFYEGDWSMRPVAQAMIIFISAFLMILITLALRLTRRWRNVMVKGSS